MYKILWPSQADLSNHKSALIYIHSQRVSKQLSTCIHVWSTAGQYETLSQTVSLVLTPFKPQKHQQTTNNWYRIPISLHTILLPVNFVVMLKKIFSVLVIDRLEPKVDKRQLWVLFSFSFNKWVITFCYCLLFFSIVSLLNVVI